MNTILSKYAAVLLPFFILVIGGTQTVFAHGFDLTLFVPYIILVIGAAFTTAVKMFPDAPWQGWLKVTIAIVSTILSALVPFFLPGGFDPKFSWQVVLLGVLNALATWLGTYIRANESKTSDDGANALAAQAFTFTGDHGVPTPAIPTAALTGGATPNAPPAGTTGP